MRLELVTIAPGEFPMGCDHGQPDERPARTVWLAAFAIAVHPVTNAQYRRFVEATGHRPTEAWSDERFAAPNQPVVAVSWFDAIAYCEWLRACTGQPCRLPTEAEREKAARGGRNGQYPWGDDPHALGLDAGAPTLPEVGGDPANGFGLHNTGNLVHEWCSDWYGAGYYAAAPTRNPAGPSAGTRRSSRGGSWRHHVRVSRCAARSSLPPDRTYTDYGFRIAVGSAPGA
ncbi:MAG: SUMF1/EgtB/PvdO family nonheme iron enzyme [Planctomycetes bacterium]|nr:SUMF1/EgtB/PvdO family nonheme iron enzyme [Planctomycetota bacterium]